MVREVARLLRALESAPKADSPPSPPQPVDALPIAEHERKTAINHELAAENVAIGARQLGRKSSTRA